MGFVCVEPVEARYRKISRGKWEVTFERGTGKNPAIANGPKRSEKSPVPKPGTARNPEAHQLDDGETVRVRKYLAALSGEERAKLEREALGNAEPFLRTLLGSGGALGKTSSQVILHRHVMKLLGNQNGSPAA